MIKNKNIRFWAGQLALIYFIALQLVYLKPAEFFRYLLFFLLVAFVLMIAQRIFAKHKMRADLLVILIIFFSVTFFAYLFIDSNVLQQVFIFANAFILYQIAARFQYGVREVAFYNSCVFYLMFLFYASAFKGVIIWNLNLNHVLMAIVMVTIVISYSIFRFSLGLYKDEYERINSMGEYYKNKVVAQGVTAVKAGFFASSVIYSFVLGFVVAELFWALNLLPTAFFVNAGVLLIFYYIIFEVFYLSLLDVKLTRKTVIKPVVIGVVGCMLVFLTASWI